MKAQTVLLFIVTTLLVFVDIKYVKLRKEADKLYAATKELATAIEARKPAEKELQKAIFLLGWSRGELNGVEWCNTGAHGSTPEADWQFVSENYLKSKE